MARALLEHLGGRPLGDVKEAGDIHAEIEIIVLLSEVDERLRNEDAGIVHERVDPAKALQAFSDDPLGGLRLADIARNGEDTGVCTLLDRSGGGDHAVVAIAIGPNQGGADALRRAGDYSDLLFIAHGMLSFFNCYGASFASVLRDRRWCNQI